MTGDDLKEGALVVVNPFRDRTVSDQLASWAAAVEMAVDTLNKTLAEFREFQQKGDSDVGDDTATGNAAGAADTGGDD